MRDLKWDKKQDQGGRRWPIIAGLVFFISVGLFFFFYGIIPSPDTVSVHFTLVYPEAEMVSLVGDFNEWEPQPMDYNEEEGCWELKIRLKKKQIYIYNFIIDNEIWITDPRSITNIDDGFGSQSSLLEL